MSFTGSSTTPVGSLPQNPMANTTPGGLPQLPKPVQQAAVSAPKFDAYALPNAPTYSGYALPDQMKIDKVEKPSFGTYFEQNIKPTFSKMLTDNLAQNPQLIQSFANQYRQDINPMIEQLGQSIYGKNVGATSGLGASAYAKGAEEIMRPVTNYANQLNANTIGQYQNTMNAMATDGLQTELKQNLNQYNQYQDRLYEQGQITRNELLKSRQDASDYANKVSGLNYEANLNQSKDTANLSNQQKSLDYKNSLETAARDAQTAEGYQKLDYASKLNQADANRKLVLDKALAGELGPAGSGIIERELGFTPEQSSAIKSAGRETVLKKYVMDQVSANQPIDEKVLNLLATFVDGQPLNEAEKAKLLGPQSNLPPSNAANKILENGAIKGELNDKFGFEYKVESDGRGGARWNMQNSNNIQRFNDLWATNPGFRDFVKANI